MITNNTVVLSLEELLLEVVGAISEQVDKKCIKQVVADYVKDGHSYYGLNELLFNYYRCVARDTYVCYQVKNGIVRSDLPDYDYTRGLLKPIKFYNTGCIIEYVRKVVVWSMWAFDLCKYVEVNDIAIIELEPKGFFK